MTLAAFIIVVCYLFALTNPSFFKFNLVVGVVGFLGFSWYQQEQDAKWEKVSAQDIEIQTLKLKFNKYLNPALNMNFMVKNNSKYPIKKINLTFTVTHNDVVVDEILETVYFIKALPPHQARYAEESVYLPKNWNNNDPAFNITYSVTNILAI